MAMLLGKVLNSYSPVTELTNQRQVTAHAVLLYWKGGYTLDGLSGACK